MADKYVNDTGLLFWISSVMATFRTKANKDTVESLATEVNTKAPLASPTFTGVPNVPTASTGTDTDQAASTKFVNASITEALKDFTTIDIQIVEALPESGKKGVFYFVKISGSSETDNQFEEFIWANDSWEKLGTAKVDLSDYMKKTDLTPITTEEIKAMIDADDPI